MKGEKFSFRKRLKSFGYAFNGLKVMFAEGHNSRIHLVAAILAVLLGCFLKLSYQEWAIISIVIGAVFSAELFNSLKASPPPEKHENIKKVKDLAAAAVLVCAITAVAVACFVFLPKIWELFEKV
ncbi:MAG: diacylglycerol kinase family protein [Bacteroidetes bacterium]|nr:diacylglycerol kinase family protein [Bacteroidota bacterium]